ncbi:hypothetical protein BYT27DRAFT_6416480 [Phlegmacium glaucopus]|nr:hypothetical protein BYT27DRAFT_6416480 [Phlegmacium glaucopus]
MQTVEPQAERSENTLTLGHLATLPNRNKDHFILTFAQQQQHFFQHYLFEGQRATRSWDPESMSPPITNPQASPKNDLHLGFGTPVLKARLDLISTRTGCPNGPIKTDLNKGQGSSKENERPSGHSANLPDAAKHDLKLKTERQKKNFSGAHKKRSKEHNLLSDSDNELVERQLVALIST